MRDLRVESRFKNAILYRAMQDAYGVLANKLHRGDHEGPPPLVRTVAEMCEVSISALSGLLNLKACPYYSSKLNGDRAGKRTPSAIKIAEVLGVEFSELFPPSLYSLALPNVIVREYESEQVLSLQEAAREHLLPSAEVLYDADAEDRARLLGQAVETLDDRRKKVVRMRFALSPYDREYTLDEVAQELGVSRERARQIESRALRHLRHNPTATKLLEPIAQ